MNNATLSCFGRGGLQAISLRPARRIKGIAAHGSRLVVSTQPDNPDWTRHTLLRRQLRLAVAEENFGHAAELRDRLTALRGELPPQQQFLSAKLMQLDFGSQAEQLAALHEIGEVGGMNILGDLAPLLQDPQLDGAAASALSTIWHRHPDPAIDELMADCCRLLAVPHAAGLGSSLHNLRLVEQMCSQMLEIDASFAEAWNKRATCRFLIGANLKESIHDCEITLGLNQYHFGAMSGQGLCHMRLKENALAIACFEQALAIYPGMASVRHNLNVLRRARDGGMASA